MMNKKKLHELHIVNKARLKEFIEQELSRHNGTECVASGECRRFLIAHGYSSEEDIVSTSYLRDMLKVMGF